MRKQKKILALFLFLFLGTVLQTKSFSQITVSGKKSVSSYKVTNDPDNATIYENPSNKISIKPSSIDTTYLTSGTKERLLTPSQENHLLKIASQHFVDLASSFEEAITSGKVTTISPEDTVVVSSSPQGLISNSILLGSGESSVITTSKSSASSLSAIVIDSDSNIVISGIHFKPQNNGSYNTEYDHAISITDSSKNILITNCIFDCVGDGVYIGGTSAQPENIVITNCTFRGDSLVAYDPPCSRNGVSIVNGKNIRIINNTIKGFHDPACIDIEPNPGSNQVVEGVVISSNTIIPNGRGISISSGSSATAKNIVISNNYIDRSVYRTSKYGIYMASSSSEGAPRNIVISGNTIKGDISFNSSYSNIQISGQSEEIQVTNNISCNSPLHGIQVSPGVKNLVINNNTCYGNYGDGIYLYGTEEDKTSYLGNVNFELAGSSWSQFGTPTTSARSSEAFLQGNYSWKVVTDYANEGIQQAISISTSDTFSIFDVKAYVYLADDASHGNVYMSVNGDRYEFSGRKARESEFDSTWQVIETFFKPSSNDTIIIAGSKSGMTFYVDSLTVTKRNGAINVEVNNNQCFGNNKYGGGYCGIRATQVVNGSISNNNLSEFTQLVNNTATQYRGLDLKEVFFLTVLGNTGYGNIANENISLAGVSYSSLSMVGFKGTWVDRARSYIDLAFPNAKVITFKEDSLTSGIATRPIQFSGHTMYIKAPTKGHIIGLSAFLTSPMTSGTLKIYPQIGSSVDTNISGRSYLYLTMTGNTSGVYSKLLPFVVSDDYMSFNSGDYITVAIYTDASFATSSTSYLTVELLYE